MAEKLGVCRPTSYDWENQLLGREAPASIKHGNDSPTVPERVELERQLESLQRDIRQLQLERDLLKKSNEIIKKGLGVDLQLLANREKTIDPDARLYKKSAGYKSPLSCLSHALMENRHGLIIDVETTLATGTAERVAYHAACRAKEKQRHRCAHDTTRHASYKVSLKKRKLVEEIFGWGKTVGELHKTRFVGLAVVRAQTIFTFAAYSLRRMATIFGWRLACG